MLPCRMFCESKPCIGGSNEFVFESTAHPKLRIFAVLCFRFPIWLFGSGTGQLSAVNCRIWWPKLYFYIRIKLLVRSDKLGKGVTCPSVTTTRLRRSDVSYAEHCDWVFHKVCYLKKKTPFNKMIRDHSGHGHSQWQIVLMFPIGCDHTKSYFWIQWIIVFSYARDPTTGCRYIVNTLPFSVQSSCSVFTRKYAELYVHIFYVLVWYSYAMPSKS